MQGVQTCHIKKQEKLYILITHQRHTSRPDSGLHAEAHLFPGTESDRLAPLVLKQQIPVSRGCKRYIVELTYFDKKSQVIVT